MPSSAAEDVPGLRLAVTAESLYLANLLIAPGVAFVLLAWLYVTRLRSCPPLAVCHLKQTMAASLWAGMLLVAVNVAIVAFGGWGAAGTWVVVILYFTTCHTTLVFLGMFGLAKAMAGEAWVYPLVGRPC